MLLLLASSVPVYSDLSQNCPNLPQLWRHTQKQPKIQKFPFFLVWTKGLATSLEGLNSSLAQSASKYGGAKWCKKRSSCRISMNCTRVLKCSFRNVTKIRAIICFNPKSSGHWTMNLGKGNRTWDIMQRMLLLKLVWQKFQNFSNSLHYFFQVWLTTKMLY